MVIIITSYNSIEITSIDKLFEDISKEDLCDLLNAKNVKSISNMNLNDDKLRSLCYMYDPEGAIKQRERNQFAVEFSNYNNIYGDIIICKNINNKFYDFEDDELAEIILTLVNEADFLQIGFIKENIEPDLDSLYLSFGKYPQSLVTDKKLSNILDTIEDTNDEGYIVYKKKEYQKLTAIGSKTILINGVNFEIEKWKSYYFLVEPLQWDILYDNDDILLICDKIVDNYYFNKKKHNLVLDNQSINENDFYFSDVRKYLNRYFLNKAFTKKEIDRIADSTAFNGKQLLDGTATALDFKIGANTYSCDKLTIAIGDMGATALTVSGINIKTGAAAALTAIDDAIVAVSKQRAELGAAQNRIEYAIESLSTTSENLSAAESRIRDVDMAEEMVNYTKDNILQQSAMAMLAQANQQPEQILTLLQ